MNRPPWSMSAGQTGFNDVTIEGRMDRLDQHRAPSSASWRNAGFADTATITSMSRERWSATTFGTLRID